MVTTRKITWLRANKPYCLPRGVFPTITGTSHAPPLAAGADTHSSTSGSAKTTDRANHPVPDWIRTLPLSSPLKRCHPSVPSFLIVSHLASRVFTRAQVHISRVERHVNTIRPLTCCKLPPRTLGHGDASVILISLVLQHPSAAMDNLHGNCWQLLMYITRCMKCSRKGATASNSHLAVPSAAAAFSGCCATLVLHLSLLLP